MESVFDALSRSQSERELLEIREELASSGYLKIRRGATAQTKSPKQLPRWNFALDDGFTVLVGRNNVQNDKLSLKTAAKRIYGCIPKTSLARM